MTFWLVLLVASTIAAFVMIPLAVYLAGPRDRSDR